MCWKGKIWRKVHFQKLDSIENLALDSMHKSKTKIIQLFQELIGNLEAKCPNSHHRRRLQMSVNSLKWPVFIRWPKGNWNCKVGRGTSSKECLPSIPYGKPTFKLKGSFLIYVQVNLCQELFFLQNMRRTFCVKKLFWMSETISAHNMFSPHTT